MRLCRQPSHRATVARSIIMIKEFNQSKTRGKSENLKNATREKVRLYWPRFISIFSSFCDGCGIKRNSRGKPEKVGEFGGRNLVDTLLFLAGLSQINFRILSSCVMVAELKRLEKSWNSQGNSEKAIW